MWSKDEIEGVALKNGGNTDREERRGGLSAAIQGPSQRPHLEAPYWMSVRATQNPAVVNDAFLGRMRMNTTVVYV